MAQLDVNIETDAIKRATAELAKMTGSTDKAASAVDRLTSRSSKTASVLESINVSSRKVDASLRGANGQFIKASENFNKNANEIHKLRMRYDEVYASSVRYAQEVDQLNNALTQGAISPAIYGQQLLKLDQAFGKAGAQGTKFSSEMKNVGGHTANVFSQLNDIGVMLAAGQSPLQLALQQGTQLNQVWGQMGGTFGAAGRTIRSALMSMLSPINLVTIGVIAGAAALVQWGQSALGADKDAAKFSEQIDALRGRIDELKSGNFTFDMGTGQLKLDLDQVLEKYGSINNEVSRHIILMQQASAAAANYASIDLMAAFKENFDTGYLTTRVDEVREAFKTTNDVAREIINSFKQIEQVKGLSNQRDAAEQLRDRLIQISGGIENMTGQQVKFLMELNNTIDAMRIAETQLGRNSDAVVDATAQSAQWAAAMSSVLSYVNAIGQSLASIGGIGISVAAARTERTLLEQGKSLREAGLAAARETAKLEGQQRTAALEKQYGIAGRIAGHMETAAKQLAISEQESLDVAREAAREHEKEAAKVARGGGGRKGGAGGGRGDAELKSAQKNFQSIRELMEQESMFQSAEYEKRQLQLDSALSKQLISQQNYEKMKEQLRTIYFGSDFEKNALQYQMDVDQLNAHLQSKLLTEEEYYRKRKELFWNNLLNEENRSEQAQDLSNTAAYFGQLHSLTGSSYDSLAKLQQSFQAASALMNAYTGASQALADPSLSYWQKFLAAGKVLAAGIGFVKAIKGGGGGSGKASAAGQSAAGAAVSSGQVSRNVNLTIIGDQFDKKSMVQMVQELNKSISDGSKLNVRTANG